MQGSGGDLIVYGTEEAKEGWLSVYSLAQDFSGRPFLLTLTQDCPQHTTTIAFGVIKV